MQARAIRPWHLDVAPQDAGRRQPRPRQEVEEAVGLLDSMPKKAAGIIAKAIKSAAANAEDKSGGDASVENLRIHTIAVDGGPIAKRWMPRSMGRANRINHRTATSRWSSATRQGMSHGSENTSDWLPPRHHQDLVVSVVRGEELRQVAA